MVKVGDVVKKGDLLISGVLPLELGGGFCTAQGEVKGRVADRVEVEGKIYPLDLSLDRVLMAMDAADDKGLSPADKIELQARLFLRRRRDLPKTAEEREKLIRAVLELFPKPEKGRSEKHVDFHQDVKDYILPFAAGAKVRVVEKSPGTTLNGNKISVSGGYGFAVIFVQKAKQSKP